MHGGGRQGLAALSGGGGRGFGVGDKEGNGGAHAMTDRVRHGCVAGGVLGWTGMRGGAARPACRPVPSVAIDSWTESVQRASPPADCLMVPWASPLPPNVPCRCCRWAPGAAAAAARLFPLQQRGGQPPKVRGGRDVVAVPAGARQPAVPGHMGQLKLHQHRAMGAGEACAVPLPPAAPARLRCCLAWGGGGGVCLPPLPLCYSLVLLLFEVALFGHGRSRGREWRGLGWARSHNTLTRASCPWCGERGCGGRGGGCRGLARCRAARHAHGEDAHPRSSTPHPLPALPPAVNLSYALFTPPPALGPHTPPPYLPLPPFDRCQVAVSGYPFNPSIYSAADNACSGVVTGFDLQIVTGVAFASNNLQSKVRYPRLPPRTHQRPGPARLFPCGATSRTRCPQPASLACSDAAMHVERTPSAYRTVLPAQQPSGAVRPRVHAHHMHALAGSWVHAPPPTHTHRILYV